MADEAIDSSRIEAAKEIAEKEEGPRRRLEGFTGWLAAGLAVAMSLLFGVLQGVNTWLSKLPTI